MNHKNDPHFPQFAGLSVTLGSLPAHLSLSLSLTHTLTHHYHPWLAGRCPPAVSRQPHSSTAGLTADTCLLMTGMTWHALINCIRYTFQVNNSRQNNELLQQRSVGEKLATVPHEACLSCCFSVVYHCIHRSSPTR